MSNVIKSFRVIETDSVSSKETDANSDRKIINSIIEDAKEEANKEYDKIISEAREEALGIIEEAEKEKESMIEIAYTRSKDILNEARDKGYNEGYESGQDEGYNIGYNEGKTESDSLIKEALNIKSEYLRKREELLINLEEDIIELVINIYEKIISRKSEEDSEMIVDLVLGGINNLDFTDKLTIIASKEDFDILEMSKDEILAKASMISELDIKYDISLSKGDCILETSKGNIDVSLKNQLEEVRELLRTILNNE